MMYDIAAAAKKLGVAKITIWQMAKQKKIKHARIGKKIMFQDEFLEEFVKMHTSEVAEKNQKMEG